MISDCSGSRCCCRREHQHHSRLLLGPAAGEFSSSGSFPHSSDVAEEAETALLREEALRETLEERYAEGREDFAALADLLSRGKDDSAFADTVLRLYTFIQSHPFPEQWLEEKAAMYDSVSDPADTVWGKRIRAHMADVLLYAGQLLQSAQQLAQQSDALREKYLNTITANLQRIVQAQLSLHARRLGRHR